MSDLLTVALICAATVSQPDCSRDTALDVIVSPATSPYSCMMQGQTMVANGLGATMTDGAYLKVSCERRRIATAKIQP